MGGELGGVAKADVVHSVLLDWVGYMTASPPPQFP